MLTHSVPTKMVVLPHFMSVGASKVFALGVEPIMLEGDSIKSRASTLIEGGVHLYDENSVSHSHTEGHLTHLPRQHFSYVSDDRWTSDYLAYKQNSSSTSIGLGNYRVPRGGTLEVVPPWLRDTPSERTAIRYFIQFSGYVIIYGSNARAGISYTRRHYNEDFSRCVSTSGSIPNKDRGEHLDLTTHLEALNSGIPSSGGRPVAHYVVRNEGAKIPRWLRYTLQRGGPDFHLLPKDPDYSNTLGVMVQEAVDSLDAFSSNGIAYINEAIQWRSLLPPVKDLKTFWKFKSASNIYLWLRFGVSLSIRDTRAIISALPKLLKGGRKMANKKTRLRSRKTVTISEKGRVWRGKYGLRVLCDSYPDNLKAVGSAIDKLYSLDVMPTTANLWDLIPLSFVVDWLIPVSEVLENLDLRGRLQSFDIYSVTISRKWTSLRPHRDYLAGFITSGTVEDVWYIRTVQSSLPLRGVFSTSPSGKTPTRRFIDGSALVIQKGRP